MEKEYVYNLLFGFTLNPFSALIITIVIAICYKLYKIFKIINARKKNDIDNSNIELQTKREIEAASVVEIAQLFTQLKEIGQAYLVEHAKQLIIDKKILDHLLTDEILQVVPIKDFWKQNGGEFNKKDLEDLGYKSNSYLIILTSNGFNMYGLHMSIDASKYTIEVHNRVYIPFMHSDSTYKFLSFDSLDEALTTLVNCQKTRIQDEYLVVEKLRKQELYLLSEARVKEYSISGSRDYSKHFWQPDIKSVNIYVR